MTSQERHQARYLRRKAKREAKRAERMREFDDFDKVFSFEHLWKAYRKCVCGVGWKASTQKYRNTPISNIAYTYLRLKGGTYKSKGFYSFTIIERGKVRHIKSVHISERVVQRCLCDFSLIPAFTPTLIHDNGACMKGKGIDFAKDRLNCHLQRYYRDHQSNEGYALVMDFSSYFDGILHEKLEEIVMKEYSDRRIISLYMHFVNMFGDVGLGLGSQISQISAIRYPNELDHAIKTTLAVRYYARYNDDSYLISESKEHLRHCLKAIEKNCGSLGIRLNRKKTQIVKLSRGIPYLKQRTLLTETGEVLRLPKKDNTRRMRRKLKTFARWLAVGRITLDEVRGSYQSWRSHLIRSNAELRLRSMDKQFNKIVKENKNGSI